MAKDNKPVDQMGYEALQQAALRGVVKAALTRAAAPPGLPGDHHFYIGFLTGAQGVSLPDDLRARYPDEMTIVLQNQFHDLKTGETGFSVTLQFGGQPKNLSIPYAAITRFYDPSVQYLIQFSPSEPPTEAVHPAPATMPAATREGGEERPNIVSLDQFRKK